jgi:class 3 adenylate cyclase
VRLEEPGVPKWCFGSIVLAAVLTLAPGAVALAAPGQVPMLDLVDGSRAYPVLGHADVLDDPTGTLDVGDVAPSAAFRPGSPDSQPPDDAVRWYRFRATAPPASSGPWFLVTSRGCSDADLYVSNAGRVVAHRSFGYRAPYAQHPAPGRNPAIDVPELTSRTLYVRLRCERRTQALYFATGEWLLNDALPGSIATTAMLVLVALAAGLAFLTRSRSYALIALSGAMRAIEYLSSWNAARWFPAVTLPPAFLTHDVLYAAFLAMQWLFYDTFFHLRAQRKRAARIVGAGFAVACACVFGQEFLPLGWQAIRAAPFIENLPLELSYGAVTAIAVSVARAGNRSAWFVAAGTTLFIASLLVTDAAGLSLLPHSLIWAWDFAIPLDLMLFVLGVGDQLRQTSLARERALQEKDAAQAGLVAEQRRHISEVERRNVSFARFVPREFLRQLDKAEIVDIGLGDHVERDMAVIFTDIRGFTPLAERLSPAETFAFLNAYLARAGPLVRAHGGFVDKYIGDAIVALFPDRASDALDAAIALQREVRRFNEDRARNGGEPIAVGIGMHFGRMMLGTIGEPERIETTVIADAVNVASRLEGMTKVFGASIIASASLVAQLADGSAYCLRPLGTLSLRGHERPEDAYEAADGDSSELLLHKRCTLDTFKAAAAAYSDADYTLSRLLFGEVADMHVLDRVAAYLRDRSESLIAAL